MKVGYRKPAVEFEDYELNAAIATGCTTIRNLGPEDGDHTACDGFKYDFYTATYALEAGTNFYENNCECYLNAAGSPLFTS